MVVQELNSMKIIILVICVLLIGTTSFIYYIIKYFNRYKIQLSFIESSYQKLKMVNVDNVIKYQP